VRFKSVKQALELGEVKSWRLSICGHSCEGKDLASCLSSDNGRETVLQQIFDKNWDQEHAEEYAREQMRYEAEEVWRSELPKHPDLLIKADTPVVDGKVAPDFEFDEDDVRTRTYEDYNSELHWCWQEILAYLKDDKIEDALQWLGASLDDVEIDEFICSACHDVSNYDGRHCTGCTAPICSTCFDNYCGVCGYDYNVEDKLELEHEQAEAEAGQEHPHDGGGETAVE
jgi:hypothetical protein